MTITAATPSTQTLKPQLLQRMNAYWRAAKYLSVGHIYSYDNPLLRRPLTLADVKPLIFGHWGTTPGQNFIYLPRSPAKVVAWYDNQWGYSNPQVDLVGKAR